MNVTVSERGDTAVVSVDGRIDAESAERLDTAISGALARGGRRVLVNPEKAAYAGLDEILAGTEAEKRESP